MSRQRLVRMNIPAGLGQELVLAARCFRKEPTPSEALLWQALRGKQLAGIRFRRQQPIGPFVVDFYAPSCRVVIEVDGSVHASQVESDLTRQRQLEDTGLRILRLPAALVETNLPEVLRRIQTFCLSTDD